MSESLPQPTGFALVGTPTATSAAFSWNAVAGAATYNVRYQIGAGPLIVAPPTSTLGCTLTGLTAATPYIASVVAHAPGAQYSPPSAAVDFTTATGTGPPPPTKFTHVVTVMFENESTPSVFGNANAPYLNSLWKQGAFADNYQNLGHPSEPNYLGITSGSTHGLTSDQPSFTVNAVNVWDRLEAAGFTVSAFMEGMTNPLQDNSLYAQKHNPFVHYTDIRDVPAQLAKIQPYTAFKPAALTNYTWISPNLKDDGHTPGGQAGVKNADAWASKNLPPILAALGPADLLITVFDESESGGNNLPCGFNGPMAKVGVVSKTLYAPGHYCCLHTVLSGFGCAGIAGDASAAEMADMLA
jgi:phosphatidylinositol-3-phosphatase